jgi:hypothetical protein
VHFSASDADYALHLVLFGQNSLNWCYFSINILKIAAGTAPSTGAIWAEFREHH